MIKELFDNLKKLDKKFIISMAIGVLLPMIYGFTRVLWILDYGSTTYAMASYWVYIQVFLEVIVAFLTHFYIFIFLFIWSQWYKIFFL